jgi:hypothetical protein
MDVHPRYLCDQPAANVSRGDSLLIRLRERLESIQA